jgi:hypothetical protein
MTAAPDLELRLVATHPPGVLRRCKRCDDKRTFLPTDKFRVNAHQRRIDVWLIYKCRVCDVTWNATVHTRILPSDISEERHQNYISNDPATAREVAFDLDMLRRNDAQFEEKLDHRVEGGSIDELTQKEARVTIDPGVVTHVRLDRFLKTLLGISTRRFNELVDSGGVKILSEMTRLDKRMKRKVELLVDLDAVRALRAEAERIAQMIEQTGTRVEEGEEEDEDQ